MNGKRILELDGKIIPSPDLCVIFQWNFIFFNFFFWFYYIPKSTSSSSLRAINGATGKIRKLSLITRSRSFKFGKSLGSTGFVGPTTFNTSSKTFCYKK